MRAFVLPADEGLESNHAWAVTGGGCKNTHGIELRKC